MLISHICISAYLSSLLKSRFLFAERDSAISNHQIQMMWAFWEKKMQKRIEEEEEEDMHIMIVPA